MGKLTQEEIDYIEDNIDPMGDQAGLEEVDVEDEDSEQEEMEQHEFYLEG